MLIKKSSSINWLYYPFFLLSLLCFFFKVRRLVGPTSVVQKDWKNKVRGFPLANIMFPNAHHTPYHKSHEKSDRKSLVLNIARCNLREGKKVK